MKPPKNYLHDPEERENLLREGGTHMFFIAQSQEAHANGDHVAAEKWLDLAESDAASLKRIKRFHGSQYIREMCFDTSNADAEYGAGWLD